MDTNELVRSLAADHGTRPRPVGVVLALALAVALPFTLMMFTMRLGMRPDVMTATHNPFFVLKFVVTLALAFTSVALVSRLVRPGADVRQAAWLLVILGGAMLMRWNRSRAEHTTTVASSQIVDSGASGLGAAPTPASA